MAGAQSNVGNLEEQALKRRERLKNLKRKREGKSDENANNEKELDVLPKPLFRSYKPLNEELSDLALEPAAPGDISEEVKNLFVCS